MDFKPRLSDDPHKKSLIASSNQTHLVLIITKKFTFIEKL